MDIQQQFAKATTAILEHGQDHYEHREPWPYGPFRKPSSPRSILRYPVGGIVLPGTQSQCGYCGEETDDVGGIPCNCGHCGAPLQQDSFSMGSGFLKGVIASMKERS